MMLFWIQLVAIGQIQSSHAAEPTTRAVVADRAVAIVGDAVVTQTDVALHKVLETLDPSFVPVLNGTSTGSTRPMIDAVIIRQTAGRIPVYQPTPIQVENRVVRFIDQWPSKREYRTFLAVHGLTDNRIQTVLKRRATVERVVLRALGTPHDNIEEWNKNFEQWMTNERKGVRVRIIAQQDTP